MSEWLLECSELTKSFAGVRALRGASMRVGEGTVHGLVGHNGAGKSTLTRIVAGLLEADGGAVSFGGRELRLGDRRTAIAEGILSVPQELTILPGLSLEENICLGNEPRHGPLVTWRGMRRRAAETLELLGAEGLRDVPVEDLPASQQRIVMIAMALSRSCRLLILDEPTASLGQETTQPLMRVVEQLPARGITVLYISHRLDEVLRLCDRISVMRDGLVVETLARGETDAGGLVARMLGETSMPARAPAHATRAREQVAVRLRGVSTRILHEVDFDVPRGEITGLTGLVGSGVDDILGVIAGVQRPARGSIEIEGARVQLRSPADALAAGIGYVAGSRASAGMRELTVRENILISSLSKSARLGLTSRAADRRRAHEFVDRLGLGDRLEDQLANLSGGNQQKAIVARLLAADARVLVLDDPTAGVDVHARAELHSLLRRVAQEGRAVVVRSSEPEELVDLADEVHVVAGGRLVESFAGERLQTAMLLEASASSGHEAAAL